MISDDNIISFSPREVALAGEIMPKAQQFLKHLQVLNYAANTLTAYKDDLQQFVGFTLSQDIHLVKHVTGAVVDDFTEAVIVGADCSPNTARRKLATLRTFFNYCINTAGIITRNPAEKAGKIKVHRKKVIAPAEDVLLRVIERIDISTTLGLRDRALLRLMFDGALRREGVRCLDIYNPDAPPANTIWPNGVVVFTNKGGNLEDVPIDSTTMAYIDAWLQVRVQLISRREPTDALFVSQHSKRVCKQTINHIVKKHGINAGVPQLHPHLFRHRRAVGVMDVLGVHSAQYLLKHKDPSTTANMYGGYANKQMRGAIRNQCPLGKGKQNNIRGQHVNH